MRQDLRSWLSPPDPSINFNTASDAHHEGTALWFIQGQAFNNWKESGLLLWLHGKRTSLSSGGFAFANIFCFHSWIWKECAQVRVFSINIIVLLTVQQLIDHPGYQGNLRRRISSYGLLLL